MRTVTLEFTRDVSLSGSTKKMSGRPASTGLAISGRRPRALLRSDELSTSTPANSKQISSEKRSSEGIAMYEKQTGLAVRSYT